MDCYGSLLYESNKTLNACTLAHQSFINLAYILYTEFMFLWCLELVTLSGIRGSIDPHRERIVW